MNSVTFRNWSVLLCPRCEGTFYDESVLETLLHQPDIRLSYLRPALLSNLSSPHPEEVDRARIGCPDCKEEMRREAYAEENPLLVDRCPNGHGIWLDDGELGDLFAQREKLHPHPDPGFIEGFRRLIGLKPKLTVEEAQPSSVPASETP